MNDVMVVNDELTEIMKQVAQQQLNNAKDISIVIQKINEQGVVVAGLAKSVVGIQDEVRDIAADVTQLKMNEEVTTTQETMLRECAQKRISEILGNDPLERQKYFKIFIQSLYRDTRQYAGLGSKISRTRKCDYQRCLDYMESWLPKCGFKELRSKADRNAKARLEARASGYVD